MVFKRAIVMKRILAIDDEKIALRNLGRILEKEGYYIALADSGEKALELLKKEDFDLVITDLRMPKVDGMKIVEFVKEQSSYTEVIVITAYGTVDSAVEAMKKGAYYYISKPYKIDLVRKVVKEALDKVELRKENLRLKNELKRLKSDDVVPIITRNSEMLRILRTAKEIAPTDCNVLITGESGTGKELLALYIHNNSGRADKPFLGVNCGAFTDELLANELFGHEKGAYTGAYNSKPGLIELANHGTLFLDEISDMSNNMQVMLLRAIQEQELRRVGGTSNIKINVRFIAASNRDIEEAVKNNEFRLDLYYRLNVIQFHLPPLSQRKEDIPLLVRHFVDKYSKKMNKKVEIIGDDFLGILRNYEFPGNVRELENIVERAIALFKGGVLDQQYLPDYVTKFSLISFRDKGQAYPTLEEQELEYIKYIMKLVDGNKTKAAQILGIDRVTLWRKLKKYGILS